MRGARRAVAALALAVAVSGGVGVGLPQAEAASGAGGCRYSAAEPVLRSGARGAAVKQVQCEYNAAARAYPALGAQIAVDGAFGPKTRAAIIRLQGYSGGGRARIAQDGVVGPQTWAKLNALAKRRSVTSSTPRLSAAERTLQTHLREALRFAPPTAQSAFGRLVETDPVRAQREIRAYCQRAQDAYLEAERRASGRWGASGGGGGGSLRVSFAWCSV